MNILNGGMLKGKKTYIVSIVGIITAVAGYLTGDIDLSSMLATTFPLFSIVFLRKSINDTNK
ncbi:MAG: hypothetical protein LBR35_00055 [Rickettsiales bacterium]|nr:hypothetical protein [Rickettsiales bacterium]